MVKSVSVLYLFVVSVNVGSKGLGRSEVERCVFYKPYLACRNTCLVDRQIIVGINLANNIVYYRCRITNTCQAEERMVGEIYDGFLVGSGHVFYHKFVVIGECKGHHHLQLARKSFLTVRACIFHYNGLLAHLIGIPYLFIKAYVASVQVVRTVVCCQLIILAMQMELAFADAVAITAYQCRQIWLRRVDDILNVVMSLYDVGYLAIFIRNHNSYDGTTIISHRHLVTGSILKNIEVCFLTLDSGLEVFSLQATKVLCFFCVRHVVENL